MTQGDGEQLKSVIASVFDRAAATYDSVAGSYFSVFGPRLVDRMDLRPASLVIDVACGKGATLAPAARRVGTEGTAVGVDLSLEMVRHARARARESEHDHVAVAVMDGEDLALRDASADALICAFSLHFFPNPRQAVRQFARVVKPGGTVAVSEWGPTDEPWMWEDDLIGRLPAQSVTSGSFDTPTAIEDLLASAGLRHIEVGSESATVRLADEDEWWTWKWSYSFRYVLEQLDVETRDRFKAEALERVRSMRQKDGIHLTLHALMAVAKRD